MSAGDYEARGVEPAKGGTPTATAGVTTEPPRRKRSEVGACKRPSISNENDRPSMMQSVMESRSRPGARKGCHSHDPRRWGRAGHGALQSSRSGPLNRDRVYFRRRRRVAGVGFIGASRRSQGVEHVACDPLAGVGPVEDAN